MSEQNNGGPAFPFDYYDEEKDVMVTMQGLTLRDYFAAKAIAQIMDETKDSINFNYADVAKHAYQVADAMLKARG